MKIVGKSEGENNYVADIIFATMIAILVVCYLRRLKYIEFQVENI
jgi:hypothetical protein